MAAKAAASDESSFGLARLLRPVDPGRFFADYWETRPLHVGRNDARYYEELLTLGEIDPLLTVLPPADISLTNADKPLEPKDYARADGTFDVVKATQLFAQGATIIIDRVHRRLPRMTAACRALAREVSAPVHCNLYLTPAGAKGFDTHFDSHDVLILQLAGSKDWTVLDAPVPLPLRNQSFDKGVHPVGEPTLTCTLRAGDLLYIPRGFLHHARSRDEVSLHATVGLEVRRWSDVLVEAVAQLCLDDPEFRLALPPDHARPGFDREAARRTFARLLKRLTDKAAADAAIDRFIDEFAANQPAYVPGQLEQAERSRSLGAGDWVGARREAIYALRVENEQLKLRAQGRELTLPADSRAAVSFALETARYRPCDLPGDWDDEDRLTLVRSLIDEGLVRLLP